MLQLVSNLWSSLGELVSNLWSSLGDVPAVVGAITGALIGVIGTQVFTWVLRRPRPLVFIDDLQMGRSERPPNAIVRPSDGAKKLMVALEEDPFVSEVIPLSGKMDEGEYVDCLNRASGELMEAIDSTLPVAKKQADLLREYVNNGRIEDFRRLWAREQNVMWPLLIMAVLRKDISLDSRGISSRSSRLRRTLRTNNRNDPVESDRDEHGDLYIHLTPKHPPPYTITIPFLWSGEKALAEGSGNPIAPVARYIDRIRMPETQSSRLEKFAKDTRRAIGNKDHDFLRTIIQSLSDTIKKYRTHLEELREQVEKELSKYDRLIVRGQISNTGGSPFSVINDGKLFIQTKGHRYTVGVGEKRAQKTFDNDKKIRMRLPNGDRRYDVPVSVAQSEVYRFAAVSDDRIEDLAKEGVGQPQVLRDLFRAGDRTCYMGVPLVLPGIGSRNRKKVRYTRQRIFRDWESTEDISPKTDRWYSFQIWLIRWLQDRVGR